MHFIHIHCMLEIRSDLTDVKVYWMDNSLLMVLPYANVT